MRFKHLLVALLALVPVSGLTASGAQGASGAIRYDVSGDYTSGSTCDGGSCARLHIYQGSADCRANCQGATTPQRAATLTINLSGSSGFPATACISKRVSGDLVFISPAPVLPPGPPTFIFATLTGHNVGHHGFKLSGRVTGGLFAGGSVSGFLSYPPAPVKAATGCDPGQFTGVLSFYPPAAV